MSGLRAEHRNRIWLGVTVLFKQGRLVTARGCGLDEHALQTAVHLLGRQEDMEQSSQPAPTDTESRKQAVAARSCLCLIKT